ncbi:MAG: hypothetical protein AB8B74_05310 [Crocinitomicaceae bacterium]
MKKVLTLILGLVLTSTVMAQKVTYNDMAQPNVAKLNGVFHLSFDKAFPKIKLDKAVTYYTDYFTVDYTATTTGHDAVITMINTDPLARRVIERYLVTLGVKTIDAGTNNLEIRPFLTEYVILPAEQKK